MQKTIPGFGFFKIFLSLASAINLSMMFWMADLNQSNKLLHQYHHASATFKTIEKQYKPMMQTVGLLQTIDTSLWQSVESNIDMASLLTNTY